MKTEIKTNDAPAVLGLLSQAIESDGLVFVSGQVHKLADGGLVGATMTEKTHQVMKNLQAILTTASLDFSNAIKVTVYLTDMAEYGEFNNAYVTYFNDPFPARETVCVKELPLGASVEVSMIAKR